MKKIQVKESVVAFRWLFRGAFFIPCAGLLIQFLFPDSEAFARSGSLMVAVSITMIYLNHFLSKDNEISKSLVASISSLEKHDSNALPQVLDKVDSETKKSVEKLNVSNTKELLDIVSTSSDLVAKVSEAIRISEFSIGVVGTIIWGFGDIRLFAFFSFMLIAIVVVPLAYRHRLFF